MAVKDKRIFYACSNENCELNGLESFCFCCHSQRIDILINFNKIFIRNEEKRAFVKFALQKAVEIFAYMQSKNKLQSFFGARGGKGAATLITSYVNHRAFLSDRGVNGLQQPHWGTLHASYIYALICLCYDSSHFRLDSQAWGANELCCSRFCLMF